MHTHFCKPDTVMHTRLFIIPRDDSFFPVEKYPVIYILIVLDNPLHVRKSSWAIWFILDFLNSALWNVYAQMGMFEPPNQQRVRRDKTSSPFEKKEENSNIPREKRRKIEQISLLSSKVSSSSTFWGSHIPTCLFRDIMPLSFVILFNIRFCSHVIVQIDETSMHVNL